MKKVLCCGSMYTEAVRCRICGNDRLAPILDLGCQALTGVFPKRLDENVETGPLQLVKCSGGAGDEFCGLVQLRHSFEPDRLYGDNYGYRSGLNQSMVKHLGRLAATLKSHVTLKPHDVVLDIGSNDGTLLRALDEPGVTLVGMDPSATKFRQYYPPEAQVIADFFSAERFRREFGARRAKTVTSVAMFYDLESPLDFVSQISEVLADDGLWLFEQSYLPTMLRTTSYDTVCHEHLEYYALRPIVWLLERAGLKIIHLALNDVNGGSICIIASKASAPYPEAKTAIHEYLNEEQSFGLNDLAVYDAFRDCVTQHREHLLEALHSFAGAGQTVLGYGASTKGNVILQYCKISARDVPAIAEVNPDKYGSYTPGTGIPIVSEAAARDMLPDVFLVLPWHFRPGIIERESAFLAAGGRLLFPLPAITVV